MGDDTEFIKLPLLQRCTHKLWKARLHGYTEASKVFQEEEDDKSAVFAQFQGLVAKFVADSNVAAQEKGLEATLYFVQNSSLAGRVAKDVVSAIIAKSIAAPKKATQELSVQIILMFIEIEKQEAVVEELVKGLEHKNPKIVTACVTTLTTSLREFGAAVVGIKPLFKPIQTLIEDRDKTVRDDTKALVVEIYRWIGDAIKPQISKLKPIQLTELDAEFAKVRGEKAAPLRYLRSQQAKQAKMVSAAAADSGEVGVIVPEVEIDPLSMIDPLNVLAKLPNDFYAKLEEKKWQDRKEALEGLDKILDYPKFEKGEYGDLVRALMKVVTKDSNVVVVGVATKCVARLAAGLKKGFHPYASATLPQLLAKFKEKKANVVTPLREAVDAIYPSTNLENMQEDVIASLDNKNPSIKAETASYLGRCFAQTSPTVLNKKLLKVYVTALLKTLNEPDPTVRDNSAEALGIAMKVVSEKVITPFISDLEPIKLAKIKECAEKAEVKTFAAKPAPKPDPPKQEAPKKVLSAGAVRAQAPKVQRPPPPPTVQEMSPEEVEEKANEWLTEAVLANLANSDWKTRLEAIENLQNVLMSMDPSETASEVMAKIIARKPGLKDNNFQVMKLKLDCLKFIAESFPVARNMVESVIAETTDKLGDPKNGTLAGETLMAFAEATNLDIVGTTVMEYAFQQKSVKVQQEAFEWLGEAIQNFGFIMSSASVVDALKKGLSSTNSAVRQSAATVAGIVHLYMRASLLPRLDEKPAAVALVNAEIEKLAGEEPLEPSRTCKIPRDPEPVQQAAPVKAKQASPPARSNVVEEADEDEDRVEEKKPVGRVDISGKITEQLLTELADKNWKVRNDALLSIQAMVTDTKIKSNLGELPPVLVQRFVDTNSKLVVTALEVCMALATAMGPGSKNHVRTFARGIFNGLGDNKQWVRQAAQACLNTWVQEAGAKEFFSGEIIPDVLKAGSSQQRIEIWTWLSELLPTVRGLPKDELCLMIPNLFLALEDRNVQVRKAGNDAVFGMMTHVGYHNMAKEVEKLKPASRPGILQILDKIRPDVPEIETKSAVKSKPEPKFKTPQAKPSSAASKSRMSVVPAKPVLRKKEEDVDTSPLLQVNKQKNQRVLDEQKLKILKWNFTQPRAEFVELLRDQMNAANFNKSLVANMFHADFKFHIKAIESLSDDLANEDALVSNLDLILKWLTLRFFDTNPSVLLKGLEYLQTAFSILIDREYTMYDVEANSFIPYLVMKIGDPKDAVRDRVHAILKQFSLMIPPAKLFVHLMDGLKSKNSRLRTESLEELGYLMEQFGTSVCHPSSAAALKEISKQISDRDNSVRSAALNAIVKAYFVDGEKVLKQVGKLNEKDMSYLEERIKRASQNRTKMAQDVTRVQPEVKKKPEPEIVEEYDELEVEPEPEPEPTPAYVPEPLPPAFENKYKMADYQPATIPSVELIEVDDSFLNEPIYIPDYIRSKMEKPSNPIVEDAVANLASDNIDAAIEGGKKMALILQAEADRGTLLPFAKQIFDAHSTQLLYANSYTHAKYGDKLGYLYKVLLRFIELVWGKKCSLSLAADEKNIKIVLRELLIALIDEKTKPFHEGGFNQHIVAFTAKIIDNSEPTNIVCAAVNLMYDAVANPPQNSSYYDLSTKCVLKTVLRIKSTPDLDAVFKLDKILYTCHLFLQAYPRHTWKDRPSDMPLKAVTTLLMNLVHKKGADILRHLHMIENPISSELSIHLKKLIKSVSEPKATKLSRELSDALSDIFKKLSNDNSGEAMVELYEFKKKHPEVDLTSILAPTTPLFQKFVDNGLRQLEKERGPLKRAHRSGTSKTPERPLPSEAPSDPNELPQYYLDKLRVYQKRLGLPVSNTPDFKPFVENNCEE